MKERIRSFQKNFAGTRARTAAVATLSLAVLSIYAWNVERYFFLGDDAFISFRYAQNLASGQGLVWNPGEYVEGYTNFLWVVILALGIRLGIEPELLSCVLGIASGAGVLLLLGRFAASRLNPLHPLVWLPLFTLALSRSFTAWSTGGLATQLFTLLILAAQLRFVEERRDSGTKAVWVSGLLFSLATLTRPEGGLFVMVASVFFATQVLNGRARTRELGTWMLPIALIIGSHLLFRFSYYGAWLPNTFYAKINGFWPEQAANYFSIFQLDYSLGYYLPLIFLGVLRSKDWMHMFFATGIAVYFAYLFAIGGGRFEFRFLVVVLPVLYWLVAEGIRDLIDTPTSGRSGFVILGAAVAAALLIATHLGSISPQAKQNRFDIESIDRTRDYALDRARQGRILAQYVDAGVLPGDLMLCVGGAGALPYYSGFTTLDFRGLNDPHIARSPIEERGTIAHEHFATEAYMRERGVVVFDSLNHLVHEGDVSKFRGQEARRGDRFWKLRAVKLGDHTMVFSTFVPEPEFQRVFGHLEILF